MSALFETDFTVHTLSDLKAFPQWVCYTPKKAPISTIIDQWGNYPGAKSNDPLTWGSLTDARRLVRQFPERYIGVGFMFVKEQRLTGVDLDKCISEDGEVSEYARAIIERLNSYTEKSPSERGIHIWVRGNIPNNIGPDPAGISKIEMYDCLRYFTVTGHHIDDTPNTIEEREEELLQLHQEVTRQRSTAKEQQRQKSAAPAPQTQAGDSPYGLAALQKECQEVAQTGEGARNHRLNQAGYSLGQLVAGHELTRNTVEDQLYSAALRSGLADREIERTLRGSIEAGMKEPRTRPIDDMIYGRKDSNGSGPDLDFILSCIKQGEYGDSILFASLFRGRVLYDYTAQVWYKWAGHWWKEDTEGTIKHLVSGKLASVYIKAGAELNLQVSQQEASAEASGDEIEKELAKKQVSKLKGQIKELNERAFSLRQVARCKNVLCFASPHDGMGINAESWDKNKWLLATPGGVLDLHTGECREGRPADYIRTVCPTLWTGLHTPAPRFERFLQEIFEDRAPQERADFIAFLQRMLGYGITGNVNEHIFTVFYGEDGRNGKDTLQHAVSDTIGDASCAISKDVLIDPGRQKAAGAPTPHLSDLQGKRLAWANEPEKGARFAIGQVKDLSGGGVIATRGPFEKKFTKVTPSHLLILLTNHKPHADPNDSAFWDRLRFITFNIRFVDEPIEPNERRKDITLDDALKNEASGILAWLVRGCLDWQKQGLKTPRKVLEDGYQYREEEDVVKQFIKDCCICAPHAKAKAMQLYEAYSDWCKAGNMHPLNEKNFAEQLKKKKLEKKREMTGNVYIGIGILNADTDNEPMYGSSQPYIATQQRLEASPDSKEASGYVGYVGLKHKLSNSAPSYSADLELSVNTLHTLHSDSSEEVINQPIELDEEACRVDPQTLHKTDSTIHTDGEEYEEFTI